MRHRRKGRVLGRSPSHQRALLKNLASALFLTEKLYEEGTEGKPKVAGRIITTLPKAKEVRPVVERCITLAIRSQESLEAARPFGPPTNADGEIDRRGEAYKSWRKSPDWTKWTQAIAPHVEARRRVATLLGNKEAMRLCFDQVAPRFLSRPGGYTRILKLAKPRLGDAGQRVLLEFVGQSAAVATAPEIEA
ncbi:MAG: L17 family ribosomal protein [Pirellulales bacterium]|nr:L17 family ribosomal protein [Pirellulales bacterium]